MRTYFYLINFLFIACTDNVLDNFQMVENKQKKNLLSFNLEVANNPMLNENVNGIIDNSEVFLFLPPNTSVSELVPTFSTDGQNVLVGGLFQNSGITKHDFSSNKTYVVLAKDGKTTKNYNVSALNQYIVDFKLTKALNSQLDFDYSGSLDESTIFLYLPHSFSDFTAFTPSFNLEESYLSVYTNNILLKSEENLLSFSEPVSLDIVTGKGVTKNIKINIQNGVAQQAYIKPKNPGDSYYFGNDLALYENTLVVGSDGEDNSLNSIINGELTNFDNNSNSAGAAYVFKRLGNAWSAEAYLKAPNIGVNDDFGECVDIDDKTIVVTAHFEDNSYQGIINATSGTINISENNSASTSGAAYIFVKENNEWKIQAYLKASNSGSSDKFGESCAIEGDRVFIGSPREDSQGSNAGAVYVFKRTGTTWSEETILFAPNAESTNEFGSAIAVSNNTLVVGSRYESRLYRDVINGGTHSGNSGELSDSGAVDVFTYNGTNWVHQAYLKASNADIDDEFGGSVSIYNDIIVVSARYEAGNSTSIFGATASSDNSLTQAGAAYVYERSGGEWSEVAYLKPPSIYNYFLFAQSVKALNQLIIIGAGGESSNNTGVINKAEYASNFGRNRSGAVFIYKRSTETSTPFKLVSYVKAAAPGEEDNFGLSVDGYNDTIVVGSPYEDSSSNLIVNGDSAAVDDILSGAGSVYTFR